MFPLKLKKGKQMKISEIKDSKKYGTADFILQVCHECGERYVVSANEQRFFHLDFCLLCVTKVEQTFAENIKFYIYDCQQAGKLL